MKAPGAEDQLPSDSVDVLVGGGGTAGAIAAIQAARAGARTMLIEMGGQLGGTTTTGGVAYPGRFHAWGRQVIAGIGWELVLKIHKPSRPTAPLCRQRHEQPGLHHEHEQPHITYPHRPAADAADAFRAEIDLRPQWDETIPLANPHKGWYRHFSTTPREVLVGKDSQLTGFPGDGPYLHSPGVVLLGAGGRTFDWSGVDESSRSGPPGPRHRVSHQLPGDRHESRRAAVATPRWVNEPAQRRTLPAGKADGTRRRRGNRSMMTRCS